MYKKILIPDSREEWLKQRRSGIGGSDAGAVLGLNPYKSPLTLWAEKTGKISDEVPDNEAMRTGRDLEEYVAKRFCEATGKHVRRSSFSYQSAEYPWMLANVDRWIRGENAILECKTANIFAESEYEESFVPDHYKAQCLHYMAVLGVDRCYLAIFIPGRKFYWFVFEREEYQEEIDYLVAAEKDFWECVTTDQMPDPDGSNSSGRTLDMLYPRTAENEVPVELYGYSEVLERYDQLLVQEKDLKTEKEIIKNEIKKVMGEQVNATVDGRKVTWKAQERTTIDSKKVKAEYPDVWEACSKTSTSSILFIGKKKKERAKA